HSTALPLAIQHELAGGEILGYVYLLVGQGGLFSEPTIVQTVLGSCISVTMFAPRYKWGGIFHALLPRQQDFQGRAGASDSFRFVDASIRALLQGFGEAGIYASDLECKVFGGASPLHQQTDHGAGKRNTDVALEVLQAEGLNVLCTCVGGNTGRKIFFRTDSGVVLQKRFLITQVQRQVY
ncbi:MAG: chemotaxis protein CheD, partial [Desulfovibrionales bacterium]|nr:chemotaxis protein CheD [Desulfovibrionales bacterium]